MELFKNREIRVFTLVCALLGAAVSLALLFVSPIASLIASLGFTALIAAFLIFTYNRYKRIAALSDDLGRMLNGDSVELSKYSEGELSLLENRLEKLVLRLQNNTEELKKEKLMLADSMADISHQIKTPLTTINLLAAALAKQERSAHENGETCGTAEREKTLADMHSQIDRMDWLVSALLKLARFDADAVKLREESVSLEELIRLATEPLEIMIELKGQQLEVRAEGFACCDASWTAEALMNIIKNYSESMGEGVLFVTAAENPLYSEIVILDSGKGIDSEDLPHIFERFYRGKNSSNSGVGIGLALARSIIIKQNGTVKAENAHGGGAKFTVRLYKGTV
ncbi:MAG: HAMP domain-containing histidine kinase [Clostridia bacterium]|nr:HAMP domain-containing histidine kinase [Clostridia bacterium]